MNVHYVNWAKRTMQRICRRVSVIVNISSIGAERYSENVAYGVAKAGVDKLAADMAEELRPHHVASVALWPGFTRTEDVLKQIDIFPDLEKTVSPLFNGRAVVALAADPEVFAKTGQSFRVSDLAKEYGFLDEPGNARR